MPKFLAALCLAVLLAIVMTITSVVMYATSGVSSIDLSRPGYEQARKGLKTVDASKTFSPTGPLDGTVIDQFNQIYTSQTTQTRSFGGFNDTAIDDGNLGLTPGATQPSGSP
ncbi:MAG TPA: hypothetical protein VH144_01410 [Candidatus Saccharimonadales bacterium]|jgi:hypothetical protein|nr:hypothetical protein [Candidatus Saccharimonadales bacterium]